ncbi:MAG: AsmA family protein [Gammaproteobacteria bacterium]|nr:MAG: AsmA family protein [Gammaproteobacteria bacterium]
MSKLFRIFITLIGAIILLGLVSLIGLVVFVNPNDLKPQISQAVTKFTGRQLQLGGDIQWSIFPWLGLQLNNVKLTNNPGFGDSPFAQIKKLDIQVRLVPLLHKQLEIGKLQIHGLTLYLIKNSKGQVNWEGPLSSSPKNNSESNNLTNNIKPLGFIITGLDIRDGHIIYIDQQKNKHLEITELQLKSANLAINKSSPFDIQFNLNSNSPVINAAVRLRSSITLSTDRKNIDFNNLNLNMFLKGPSYPKGELPISLKSHINLDLNKQAMIADQLIAFINQIKLTGRIIGQHILNNPGFAGTLASQQIKTGNLVFQQIHLGFQFSDNLLTLNPINAKFYQGNYQGNASINLNSKVPKIAAQNQFNQINTALLFQDLINKSQIQLAGLATLNLNVSTAGDTADVLIRNLTGQGRFNLDQGALKGINLSYWIALGKALLKHEVTPKNTGPDTPFDKFNGSFNINQGVVSNNDLIITSGRLRVNGRGTLNLPLQQINYEVQAQPLLADGSPEGIAIPIRISGPLQHISVSPILDQLSVGIIKEKLKGKLGDTLKKLDLNKLFH